MSEINTLKRKAHSLSGSAGCYLMKNKNNQVIYVGKAKNLKSRVSSYFNQSAKSPKTTILVSHIRDFDFVVTNSEAESLILENNLIKEHKPKYNIRMRDDKSYPYAKINGDTFARLEYLRRPKKKKGDKLFGPFPTGSNISEVLRTLTKVYQLRDCSKSEFNSRKEPCMLYQIKQCSAPCVGKISDGAYQQDLTKSLAFLSGRKQAKKNILEIEDLMLKAAEEEAFERAAYLRDQIKVLSDFLEQYSNQEVENLNAKSVDIMAFYPGDIEIDISIYQIRNGLLLGFKNFHFLKSDFTSEIEHEVLSLLSRYYQENTLSRPDNFVTRDQSFQVLEELDLGIKVHKVTKKYEALYRMTLEHAGQLQEVRLKNEESVYIGLGRLKELLGLTERPKILECYDVAVWQGKSPTAAQIVFEEGKPDKKRYRHYKLQERPEGNNDFAMMQEVISRRIKYGDLPDVFIIDGGKAQVSVVRKVFEEFNINVPIAGIAKEKLLKGSSFKDTEVQKSDERLVIPGRSNPYILSKCPALMRILVQMRDEAHRFSRRLHHKVEKDRLLGKKS